MSQLLSGTQRLPHWQGTDAVGYRILLRCLFALLLSVISVAGQGQNLAPAAPAPAQFSTRLFNARDGLPDNKVSQLLETHKNPFLWAITTNELCRFEGYRFTTVWEKLPDIGGMAENSRGELVLWHFNKQQILSCFEPDSGRKTPAAGH